MTERGKFFTEMFTELGEAERKWPSEVERDQVAGAMTEKVRLLLHTLENFKQVVGGYSSYGLFMKDLKKVDAIQSDVRDLIEKWRRLWS